MDVHRQIRCAEIWGGITAVDQDIATTSLSLSIHSAPCRGEAGGDIYYVSVCGGDQLTRIAIADLQGHGEEVSAMSRRIYTSLTDHLSETDNCVVLQELNQFALEQGFEAMTTAVVVSFRRWDQTMSFTYAGHPPVLLRQKAGAQWNAIAVPASPGLINTALGIFADARYEQHTVALGGGDRFCVYTDGVTDCPNPDAEAFGDRRLRALLNTLSDQPLAEAKRRVLDALRAYAGGPLDADDTTLVLAEVAGVA